MSGDAEKTESSPRTLNVGFIGVAFTYAMFCRFIFPTIFEMLKNSGTSLSDLHFFFIRIFDAIQNNQLVYLLACTFYYFLSLKIFKREFNITVNIGLLILLALGLYSFYGVLSDSLFEPLTVK